MPSARPWPPSPTPAGLIATGDYAATINWGDGSAADVATIRLAVVISRWFRRSLIPTSQRGPLRSSCRSKTRTRPTQGDRRDGFPLAAATVADAPLAPVAILALASQPKGTPLNGVTVASFTDGNPSGSPADFTATIDWGDGSPLTLGTIAQPGGPGTAFVVRGTHTYVVDRATPYTITVAISDRGGRGLTATTTAAVADAAPPGQWHSSVDDQRDCVHRPGCRDSRKHRPAARAGRPFHGHDQLGRRLDANDRDHRGHPWRQLGDRQPYLCHLGAVHDHRDSAR